MEISDREFKMLDIRYINSFQEIRIYKLGSDSDEYYPLKMNINDANRFIKFMYELSEKLQS